MWQHKNDKEAKCPFFTSGTVQGLGRKNELLRRQSFIEFAMGNVRIFIRKF